MRDDGYKRGTTRKGWIANQNTFTTLRHGSLLALEADELYYLREFYKQCMAKGFEEVDSEVIWHLRQSQRRLKKKLAELERWSQTYGKRLREIESEDDNG